MPINLEVRASDPTESGAVCHFEFGERCGLRITASHCDWNTSRIGLLDEQIVSHVAIYDTEIRIGLGLVRNVGVDLVRTSNRSISLASPKLRVRKTGATWQSLCSSSKAQSC